jgi:hypothetical protein
VIEVTVTLPLWLLLLAVGYLAGGLWLALAVRADPSTGRLRVTDWIVCVLAGVPLVAEWVIEGWMGERTRK